MCLLWKIFKIEFNGIGHEKMLRSTQFAGFVHFLVSFQIKNIFDQKNRAFFNTKLSRVCPGYHAFSLSKLVFYTKECKGGIYLVSQEGDGYQNRICGINVMGYACL